VSGEIICLSGDTPFTVLWEQTRQLHPKFTEELTKALGVGPGGDVVEGAKRLGSTKSSWRH